MSCHRGCTALILIATTALAGCSRRPPSQDPSVTDPKALYDAQCARCHARSGEPGGPRYGGSVGPDLSHVGSATGMTPEWLFEYIKNPQSKRPKTARLMPAFGEVLTDEQIRSLAEWLAAKK